MLSFAVLYLYDINEKIDEWKKFYMRQEIKLVGNYVIHDMNTILVWDWNIYRRDIENIWSPRKKKKKKKDHTRTTSGHTHDELERETLAQVTSDSYYKYME